MMRMILVLLTLLLLLGGGPVPSASASAPALQDLDGWYKAGGEPKVYVGVYDLDTCTALLKIGTPGICVHLSFTAGDGDWWQVVRSGASTVLILGHTGTEQACKKQIPEGTHVECIQAQVKEEAAP